MASDRLEDSRPRAIVTNAAFAESIPSKLREIIVVLQTLAHEHAEPAAAGALLPPIGTPQGWASPTSRCSAACG